MQMDKSYWPRSLLWHGWLPLLSGLNGGSPWSENPAEGAGNLLECALGSYTSGMIAGWQLPVWLLSQISGLMVAWFRIRSLVFHRLDRFFLLLVYLGLIGGGTILMMMLVVIGPLGLAVVTVLLLVLYRLFREQSSGVSFLLFKLLQVFILELMI